MENKDKKNLTIKKEGQSMPLSFAKMVDDKVLNEKLKKSRYREIQAKKLETLKQIMESIPQVLEDTTKCYLNFKNKLNYKGKLTNYLFYETHKESQKFLKQMLSILNAHVSSLQEFKILLKQLRQSLPADMDELNEFLYYLEKFVQSGYFAFDCFGKILPIIPKLSLNDSLSNWTKIVQNSKIKNYDSLILENGEIYLALYEHELLAYWLSINNIDISSCLRVHQSFDDKSSLFLSSLAPYPYHANAHDDLLLYLTEAQAKSLYLFYKKLGKGKAYYNGYDFETFIIENTENLGANVKDKHSNLLSNLKTINMVALNDFDDVKVYNLLTAKFQEHRLNLAYLK